MDPVADLRTYGYAVVPSVFQKDECERMCQVLDSMEKAQREAGNTDHMTDSQVVLYCADLANPSVFLPLIDHPGIIDVVSKILPAPYILNSVSASRSGPRGGSKPHIDGRIPLRDVQDTTHISAVICLDDYTEANGAINFWPTSHTTGALPPKGLLPDQIPGRISAEAEQGSLLFFLGSTWHEVGKNQNGKRRWGLILTYCRWWVKPTYDYTQCGPEIYRRLTPRQKELYGFTSRPPAFTDKRHLTLTRVEDLPKECPV